MLLLSVLKLELAWLDRWWWWSEMRLCCVFQMTFQWGMSNTLGHVITVIGAAVKICKPKTDSEKASYSFLYRRLWKPGFILYVGSREPFTPCKRLFIERNCLYDLGLFDTTSSLTGGMKFLLLREKSSAHTDRLLGLACPFTFLLMSLHQISVETRME